MKEAPPARATACHQDHCRNRPEFAGYCTARRALKRGDCGKKKAVVAVGHTILTIAYHLAAFCFPGAEDGQDLVPRPGYDRLVRHMADGTDGLAHLLDVRCAAITLGEVPLDRRALVGRQDVLQIWRHQLDELFAHDFVVWGAHG